MDLQAPPALDRQNLVMPQAPAVEKSLLSMMTIDPMTVISQCVSDGMTDDYFYVPAHRLLWGVFQKRYEKGLPIDVTSVA